jgi:hypothetical protein
MRKENGERFHPIKFNKVLDENWAVQIIFKQNLKELKTISLIAEV